MLKKQVAEVHNPFGNYYQPKNRQYKKQGREPIVFHISERALEENHQQRVIGRLGHGHGGAAQEVPGIKAVEEGNRDTESNDHAQKETPELPEEYFQEQNETPTSPSGQIVLAHDILYSKIHQESIPEKLLPSQI